MSEHVYFLTLILPLATILIVFGMRYFSAIQQAKARLGGEEAYRQIAEKSASAEAETAAALSAIQATLTEVRGRLAAVESILKAVE